MKKLSTPAIEQKIDALLAKMTLLEKVGQLTQLGPSIVGGFDISAFFDNPDPDLFKNAKRDFHEDWIREGTVGSYLGVMGVAEINRLQKIALEESRLGIPLIFGLDVIHGYRTIFPIPLAEACTWEPEQARISAEIAAREAAAAGIHWTFAPMVDIARDARWGRIAEGSGEDTYLGSVFAEARVKGFQGDDLTDAEHVLACAKHYVAYGAAEAGRDYNRTDLSLQTLHDVYLPPFQAAVEAGVGTLMSAFNELNGVPTSAHPYTLTTVLRGQWGFEGFVVSDSNSIGELVNHRFAEDRKDAGKKALMAGVDMDMVTESYRWEIPQLVDSGELPLSVVDEAVRRVLRLKFVLGLFDHPYRSNAEIETAAQLRADHRKAAREAARRSFVLFKNENELLPLQNAAEKTIALIGPLAENAHEMLGSWAFTGSPKDVVTIAAGLQQAYSGRMIVEKGCAINAVETENFTAAVRAAQQADVVVAVVGESSAMSGEAASRMELGLPGNQQALLQALKATGKPIVVLLVNGRPLALPQVLDCADAVLEIWQPGVEAGHAVADVLLGTYNPSGKLAVSFPYAVGQCPIFYNHPATGRPSGAFKFTSKYLDGPTEPLFPFGFGLSYTRFAYAELTVSNAEVDVDDVLEMEVTLTNTGKVAGEEVAQVYIADLIASRVRPVKELKAFQKVALQAGESKRLHFSLPVRSFGFHDEALNWVVEPGKFKLYVGGSSQQGLEADFVVK